MGSVNDIIKEALKNPPTDCDLVMYNHFPQHVTILPNSWIVSENEQKETYHLSFTFKKTYEIDEYLNQNKNKPIYFDFKFFVDGEYPKIEMSGYIIGLTTDRLYTTSVLYQPKKIYLIYPPIQLIAKGIVKKIPIQLKVKAKEQEKK